MKTYTEQLTSDLSSFGEVYLTIDSSLDLEEDARRELLLAAAIPDGMSVRDFILSLADQYK